MERKIGEIKQINEEWYQCVEGRCKDCYFSEKRYLCKQFITKNLCTSGIIFKKLEKVGEPYEFDGHLFQSYRTFEVPIFTENYATVRELGNNSKISIEIKQTKEDMEEKKLNLTPFDIQKAREGKPVCTRDGQSVRIICFDAKRKDGKKIIALVPSKDYPGFEDLIAYPNNGNYYGGHENDGDLMMLPEKKEGWVNVYRDGLLGIRAYKTRKEAYDNASPSDYVDTVKIEWEE